MKAVNIFVIFIGMLMSIVAIDPPQDLASRGFIFAVGCCITAMGLLGRAD